MQVRFHPPYNPLVRGSIRLALLTGWCAAHAFASADTAVTNAPIRHLPEMVVNAPANSENHAARLPAGAPLNTHVSDHAACARQGVQDAATLLEQVPGAAVVRNGPLTGIAQVRGLSGDRIRIQVDGRTLSPACPNHMDPPLHYASPAGIGALLVMAGVVPVSLGGDSLGGTVLVQPQPPRFATNGATQAFGEIGAAYHGVNDGYGADASAGMATSRESAAYAGAWQTADDLRVPEGRVRDTGFDTQHHAVTIARRTHDQQWSLDGTLLRTRDAGTPALPMDMIVDDGFGMGLTHDGSFAWGLMEARAYLHTIDHRMDNYSLRPVAAGAPRMESPAESDDAGIQLGATLVGDANTLRTGADMHGNAFDAYQRNVATGARQDTLNDATRTRVGVYTEWERGGAQSPWSTLLGLRSDAVMSDAGTIDNFFPAAAQDAAQFNAADRSVTDVSVDAAATLRYTADANSTYEIGVSRKNRAPSLLERYLWTPLSASAGQADGRTYLGNRDLDPETAYAIAATADWHTSRWQVQVSPFAQSIEDYIQGTPVARLDSQQRPVLHYQNVDRVELYGVDGMAGVALTDQLAMRATVSYVRGRNTERDDNLYRIAPLRGAIDLDHRLGGWENNLNVVLVAEQNKVSRYNDETPSDDYAVLNVRTGYTWPNQFQLQLGVENLLDARYADHLGGINRVGGSDIAIGERIPGAGRAVMASARCAF